MGREEDRLRRRSLRAVEAQRQEAAAATRRSQQEHQARLRHLQVVAAKEVKMILRYRTRPEDWKIGEKIESWGDGERIVAGSRTRYYVSIIIQGVTIDRYMDKPWPQLNDRYDGRLTEVAFGQALEARGP